MCRGYCVCPVYIKSAFAFIISRCRTFRCRCQRIRGFEICKNFFTRAFFFFFFWFHSIFRKIPYTETIVRYRQNVRENLYDPMERRRYSWNQVRVSLQTNFSYGGKREKLKYISVTFFLLFFNSLEISFFFLSAKILASNRVYIYISRNREKEHRTVLDKFTRIY